MATQEHHEPGPGRRKRGRPPADKPFTASEIAFYRTEMRRRGWDYPEAAERLRMSESNLRHLLPGSDGQPSKVTATVRERFTQVLGAGPDGSGLRSQIETRLPIDCWPTVCLRIAGKEFFPKIKVVGTSRRGLSVRLRDTGLSWEPPGGFSHYPDFRDSVWSANQSAYDADRWHVAWWDVRKDAEDCQTIEVGLKATRYKDVVATSTPQTLARSVQLDDGSERTVREWLAADRKWAPSDREPYPRGANSLTTNTLVVTNAEQAVVSRQGRGNLVSQGVWVASSSGQVERDDFEHGVVSATRAALRETAEEIGLREELGLQASRFRWLGAMVRLDMGWHAVLGEVSADINAARAQEIFDAHRSEDKPMSIDFVDLNPASVASFLHSRNCGVVLSFHLWLALWSRGHDVTLEMRECKSPA
jgi:hypothetical protein